MKKHKRRGMSGGISSFLFGVLLSFGFLISLSLIASIFLISAKNPTKNLGAVSLAVLLICALISGFVNSKRGGENGIAYSVVTSLSFTLLLVIISLILTKGKMGGMLFMNYLCYMMVAAFSAFLGKRRKRTRRR